MMTTNDVAKILDTVLSSPGMNEVVKIDLKISRKNVLLLNQVISRGVISKNDEKSTSLLGGIPSESMQELKQIADEFLQKAGLIEFNEKLITLSEAAKI